MGVYSRIILFSDKTTIAVIDDDRGGILRDIDEKIGGSGRIDRSWGIFFAIDIHSVGASASDENAIHHDSHGV